MTETDSVWNAKARCLEKYLNHLHSALALHRATLKNTEAAARSAEVVSRVTEIDRPEWQ